MPKEKLRLYFRPGTCSLAPHILLNVIGANYDLTDAPRDDSYKAINPSGAVPALDIGNNDVLTQCNAIRQYICDHYDRADLLGGEDIRQRAEVTRWCAFLTGDFHPAFFPFFLPQRYTTDHDKTATAKVKSAGLALVRNGLDQIEAHLKNRRWFVGDGQTVVDYYAVPMLRWVTFMMPGGLSDWPETREFYDRICKEEAVIAAMTTQGIKP